MGKWRVRAAPEYSSKESFPCWCPQQARSPSHPRCLGMPALGEVSRGNLVEVSRPVYVVGASLKKENCLRGRPEAGSRKLASLMSGPFSGFPVTWPDPGGPCPSHLCVLTPAFLPEKCVSSPIFSGEPRNENLVWPVGSRAQALDDLERSPLATPGSDQ